MGERLERRQPLPPPWRRFHRRGDFWRNPIVAAVIAGMLLTAGNAAMVYAWEQGTQATQDYWRRYGAAVAAEAQHTNNPDKLREIIERVQTARPN